MDKLKKTIKDSIRNFEQSYPIEAVRESLAEAGVDLDTRNAYQDKFIKQLKFKLRAKANREKQEELLLTATQYFQDALNKGLDKPIAFLNNLINQNKVKFQYSKLKEINEEGIKEIIKDHNLIEIIEMIESESEGK
ncbi:MULTISPECIES: hypothetical protein [Aequorivita]|jgi:hypothetical protein|uniref:Uncharacterized protein n=2 Tax=Aequorivita TaxID=153265 RepID=A0A137RLT0_9FLAO|nr:MULTISPECIES: hypothetical protein [Aequorivita]KXO01121.1 hypothetical protein LS48_01200 [Aequorivita aquimaris]WGF91712.1 hypothetical protein QCQ61_10880 [Aequorivita sp. Ant34-E75]